MKVDLNVFRKTIFNNVVFYMSRTCHFCNRLRYVFSHEKSLILYTSFTVIFVKFFLLFLLISTQTVLLLFFAFEIREKWLEFLFFTSLSVEAYRSLIFLILFFPFQSTIKISYCLCTIYCWGLLLSIMITTLRKKRRCMWLNKLGKK